MKDKNTRYRYYFPRDSIYNTSKFTERDWQKWWRDKALLDYLTCESEMFKTKPNTNERIRLSNVVSQLGSRFIKLDDDLVTNFKERKE